jgi:hypothetical protein
MKSLWDSLDKETFPRVLAFFIVVAWLAMVFLGTADNQTLTAVVMLVIGYFYGSSTGSKRKDDALLPPVGGGATTLTTTATSTKDEAKK